MRGTRRTAVMAALSLTLVGVHAPAQVLVGSKQDQPPYWDDAVSDEERVRSDGRLDLEFRATDPEGTPLRYTVEQMPPGARLEWRKSVTPMPGGGEVIVWIPAVTWEPRGAEVGTHEVRVTASDGHTTINRTVAVIVEEEWETFLMPGLAYSVYQPVAQSSLGTFHGPSAELLLAGWIHRNDNRGPSHVRVYASVGLLASTESGLGKAVVPSFGFDLSIERNPQRAFLIPYFGLETGMIAQREIGAPGYVLPFVGGHLWSGRNLFVNVSGGYAFPMRNVDMARGYLGKISVDFSLW